MAAITLYFDVISPFAYVAWHQLQPLAQRHGRTLEPVPILFAALLETHGTKGPAEVPAKRSYVFKDAYRKAHAAGLPLVPPPAHPFNPLLALRAAGLPMTQQQRTAFITALFARVWGGGSGVTAPAEVAAAATEAGLDGALVVERAQSAEAKQALKDQTAQCLAAGCFGVPSMLADGELFWGVDALPHLEAFLEGRDPAALLDMQRWADLPAQAVRTQR